jgi:hypothetical protein
MVVESDSTPRSGVAPELGGQVVNDVRTYYMTCGTELKEQLASAYRYFE